MEERDGNESVQTSDDRPEDVATARNAASSDHKATERDDPHPQYDSFMRVIRR